ncbi:MAG: HIT domain-containing protein [Acidimicrobiaceae bacterium]|nr:HIT domain-containing protein [Acidimicrobiaceae bacterium]
MVEHLWAGWRMAYVAAGVEEREGSTLFEAILDSDLPDEETFIVWRGDECFALMNLHPYTSGHVMVLPKRGVAELAELTDSESAELWEGVRAAVAAVTAAFAPHGVNVGANLGRGAGAGIPDHLHIHVVPRWDGDTNFMTAIANTRVLPEAMIDSWRRIVDAWA